LMINHEGLVVDVKNNSVSVVLETLGYQLTATFDKRNLELSDHIQLSDVELSIKYKK